MTATPLQRLNRIVEHAFAIEFSLSQISDESRELMGLIALACQLRRALEVTRDRVATGVRQPADPSQAEFALESR